MRDDSGRDPSSAPWETPARQVTSAIASWRAARPGILVVAIDGHGTAGKSTIAAGIAGATGAALVHTDDFFLPQHRTARYA